MTTFCWDQIIGKTTGEAEKFWHFVEHCVKIDNAKEAGTELDEMEAHRFLKMVKSEKEEMF